MSRDLAAPPFGSMGQLAREMDRLWDSFFGHSLGAPTGLFGNWPFETQRGFAGREGRAPMLWSPRIDVQQRDDAVHVHADLPGCRKEDVHIEATEEGIAISGERSLQRVEGAGD
jgi:HSP20 family molecular chaperone IbpA